MDDARPGLLHNQLCPTHSNIGLAAAMAAQSNLLERL
jgi:hypothetical protein